MIRTQVLKHLPGEGKDERGRSKDFRKGATARVTVKKSIGIKVIERKKVGGDCPIKFSSQRGSELKYLLNPRKDGGS